MWRQVIGVAERHGVGDNIVKDEVDSSQDDAPAAIQTNRA